MQETKAGFCVIAQAAPVFARGFQQTERAVDVGFNERGRAVNRAVNMAFCGKMHNRTWLMFGKQAVEQCCIADVTLHEQVPGIILQGFQGIEIACVSQFIQIHNLVIGMFCNKQPHHMRTNKTCTTCN